MTAQPRPTLEHLRAMFSNAKGKLLCNTQPEYTASPVVGTNPQDFESQNLWESAQIMAEHMPQEVDYEV